MFDRTVIVPSGDTHYHTTKVTEKRAPTDESVKLLREMEKSAQEQVDKSIRLTANGFECVVQAFRTMLDDDYVFRVHFSLNGQRFTAEHRQSARDDPRSIGKGVLKAISDEIAQSALPDLIKAIDINFGKSFFQRKGA